MTETFTPLENEVAAVFNPKSIPGAVAIAQTIVGIYGGDALLGGHSCYLHTTIVRGVNMNEGNPYCPEIIDRIHILLKQTKWEFGHLSFDHDTIRMTLLPEHRAAVSEVRQIIAEHYHKQGVRVLPFEPFSCELVRVLRAGNSPTEEEECRNIVKTLFIQWSKRFDPITLSFHRVHFGTPQKLYLRDIAKALESGKRA